MPVTILPLLAYRNFSNACSCREMFFVLTGWTGGDLAWMRDEEKKQRRKKQEKNGNMLVCMWRWWKYWFNLEVCRSMEKLCYKERGKTNYGWLWIKSFRYSWMRRTDLINLNDLISQRPKNQWLCFHGLISSHLWLSLIS